MTVSEITVLIDSFPSFYSTSFLFVYIFSFLKNSVVKSVPEYMVTVKISSSTETYRLELKVSLCFLYYWKAGFSVCNQTCVLTGFSVYLRTHITLNKRICTLVIHTVKLFSKIFPSFYHPASSMKVLSACKSRSKLAKYLLFLERIVQCILKDLKKMFKPLSSLIVILIFGIYTEELIQNIRRSIYSEQFIVRLCLIEKNQMEL